MTDREKQIEELQDILINNGIFNNLVCRQDYAYPDALIIDLCLETAQVIYNSNYRKMDEITLKLDLGDRSAEEIQQIAEAFTNEPTTAILVPSNESEIRKQVAKDILQEFWHIERGQTELDNVCIRIADKFGLLKELQGEYRYEKDKN